jgi:hypothetical protein
MTTQRQPWDRQSHEPQQAYAAFRLFLEAGRRRRVTKVAETCEKSESLVYRWSSRWSWLIRADAWDRHLDAEYELEMREARREMARRHVKIARAAIAKAAQALLSLDVAELKPADAIRVLDVATRIEREALGGDVHRVELSGPDGGPIATYDVSLLSDEERRARMEMLRRELTSRLADGQPPGLRAVE